MTQRNSETSKMPKKVNWGALFPHPLRVPGGGITCGRLAVGEASRGPQQVEETEAIYYIAPRPVRGGVGRVGIHRNNCLLPHVCAASTLCFTRRYSRPSPSDAAQLNPMGGKRTFVYVTDSMTKSVGVQSRIDLLASPRSKCLHTLLSNTRVLLSCTH